MSSGRIAPVITATDALRGLDAAALSSALSMAARAAAITCSRRGADLPSRTDLYGISTN